jgi:hypothetical protein
MTGDYLTRTRMEIAGTTQIPSSKLPAFPGDDLCVEWQVGCDLPETMIVLTRVIEISKSGQSGTVVGGNGAGPGQPPPGAFSDAFSWRLISW